MFKFFKLLDNYVEIIYIYKYFQYASRANKFINNEYLKERKWFWY